MSPSIRLLDVTLRDGGYRTNFHFSESFTDHLIQSLSKSGVDHIEIGYRKGPLQRKSTHGPAALCDEIYLRQLAERHPNDVHKFCVMVHPQNVTPDDFEMLQTLGIRFVRVCYPIKDPLLCKEYIDYCRTLGLKVSLNLTRISEYSLKTLLQLSEKALECCPDVLYFADSNGSLFPSTTEALFQQMTKFTGGKVPLGFHAHDNLSLAFSNSLEALKNGATYIDSAMLGMGKGVGNLATELILTYLNGFEPRYTPNELLSFSDKMYALETAYQPITSHRDMLSGLYNLSVDKLNAFRDLDYTLFLSRCKTEGAFYHDLP